MLSRAAFQLKKNNNISAEGISTPPKKPGGKARNRCEDNCSLDGPDQQRAGPGGCSTSASMVDIIRHGTALDGRPDMRSKVATQAAREAAQARGPHGMASAPIRRALRAPARSDWAGGRWHPARYLSHVNHIREGSSTPLLKKTMTGRLHKKKSQSL